MVWWDVARESHNSLSGPASPPGSREQATEASDHARKVKIRRAQRGEQGNMSRGLTARARPAMGTEEAAAHGHGCRWFRARGRRATRGPPRAQRGVERERDGLHRGMCRQEPTAER